MQRQCDPVFVDRAAVAADEDDPDRILAVIDRDDVRIVDEAQVLN
jgi:hypothetical protein